MKRLIALLSVAVVFTACGSASKATPTPTIAPTATVVAKVYVLSTSDGMGWVRRVASAYDLGDVATAESQCSEGQYRLALQDLQNVGTSDDRGAGLDEKILESICDDARQQGWSSISDAVHHAVGQ